MFKLKQIKSYMDKELNLANITKITTEQELILTRPVEIVHPTNFIHLPYVHKNGQIWQAHATGGSGIYSWSVENPEVVSITGSVEIKSVGVG